MKSVIIDFHAGCTSSLVHMLHHTGSSVKILALTSHKFVLEDNGYTSLILARFSEFALKFRLRLRPRLGENPTIQTAARDDVRIRRGKQRYDVAWVAFPPALYRRVLRSGVANHVVVWVSHRADLHLQTASERAVFWRGVKDDHQRGSVTFVAANPLDAEYFFHYSGIQIETLLPSNGYLKPKVCNLQSAPGEIIIASHHIRSDNLGFREIQSKFSGKLPYLRDLYPKYSWEEILQHRALVYVPYSAYSISLMEYLNLGFTLLVPTDRWLIEHGLLNDVRLYPLYASQNEVEIGESLLSPGASLNEGDDEILFEWMKLAIWNLDCYQNRVKRWDSLAELEQLIELDYSRNVEALQESSRVAESEFGSFLSREVASRVTAI